jgi:hypothetical protein
MQNKDIPSEKWRKMDIVHIDKCRYEIQEQKEVLVWYIGICQPISSTA